MVDRYFSWFVFQMSSISSFDEHLNILMKNSLVWRLYSSSYHGLYQFYSLDALRYYNPLHLQATNLHLNSFIFHNCCGKSEILYTKVKISFQLFIPSMNVCQGPHHQILIFLYILIWKCNQYFIKALKEGHIASNAIVGSSGERVCHIGNGVWDVTVQTPIAHLG